VVFGGGGGVVYFRCIGVCGVLFGGGCSFLLMEFFVGVFWGSA